MVMAFRLAEQGFMKRFEGFWRMEPMPDGDPEATLAVLHQNVLPVVYAPGLNWVVTKICKAQVEAMLQDVQAEVDRIKAGNPIPEHQQEKMKGKRSWVTKPVNGFNLDLDGDSDDGSVAALETTSDNHSSGAQNSALPSQEAAMSSNDQWPLLDAAKHNMMSIEGNASKNASPSIVDD